VPLPRSVARFNRVVTNPVLRPLVRHVPGFAVVTHVGRKSGRTYRSPVNLFRAGDRYVIALTYGRDAEWVRNVLAAGGCDLETVGRTIRLTSPEVVHDPARTFVPAPIRPILGAIRVTDFMVLSVRQTAVTKRERD
jgi:deazaflavin-dependent oxidoreductase (nitroreductase family)